MGHLPAKSTIAPFPPRAVFKLCPKNQIVGDKVRRQRRWTSAAVKTGNGLDCSAGPAVFIKYHYLREKNLLDSWRFCCGRHICYGSRWRQESQPQNFTLYPPSVYMQFFQACSSDKPCTRTEDFRVDPMPKGCCILPVTNGNGQGKDEVHSFEVFLNGKSVLSSNHSSNARATVAVQTSNKIKVILTGERSSKVLVLIAYDPRQSE